VNLVFVFGVDDEIREVEWPPDHLLATVERAPGESAVLGSVEAVLRDFRLDERVNNIRFRGGNRHRDASPGFRRESGGRFIGEVFPGRTSVGRLEQPAAAERCWAVTA